MAGEFHRLWRDVGERWGITLTNDAYIFTIYGVTQQLMKRWLPDSEAGLMSNLLGGGEEVESVEIILSVVRIAHYIGQRPALRRAFLETEEAMLLDQFQGGRLDPELTAMLGEHISRYGDRSMEELKVENPSLREDPTVLFRGIRRFIRSDLQPEAFRQAEWENVARPKQCLPGDSVAGRPVSVCCAGYWVICGR